MNNTLQEAIKRSQSWWYCDNIVCHKGQVGLLRMDFQRVFILIRDDMQMQCTYEEFRDNIAEVNFFSPSEREEADIESILTDAWNFMSLQEQEEERLAEEYENDDLL